jgi:hypothetical protein
MYELNYIKIILEFIWNNALNYLIKYLTNYIIFNFKIIIKNVLSYNKYLNKYLIKYKKGTVKLIASFDTSNIKKSLYTNDYKTISKYILTNNSINATRLVNTHNNVISKYNIIADGDFEISKHIYAHVHNEYNKNTNTINSFIELYSYTETNSYIKEFINGIN